MSRAVVLVGPPGSGKSTIGRALGAAGLRWREVEAELVERWGGREGFLAAKATALPALHADLRAWVAQGGPAAVVESTGLSDAGLLEELRAGGALVVLLRVGEDRALARVAARPQGVHLSDDPEASRAVWRAHEERVAPVLAADLVLDTAARSVDDAVADVLAALGGCVSR